MYLFSFVDMVAQRKDITVGVKHRLSDTAKFVKKKVAQLHEGVRTVTCMCFSILPKMLAGIVWFSAISSLMMKWQLVIP